VKLTVVYVAPHGTQVIEIDVPDGITVGEAVAQSGLAQREPLLNLEGAALGVWNRRVTAQTIARDGDRIEVYRPLTIDPKDARRRRAALRGTRKP
jgi:putative ubiquitin-RnfH superfamily antitoxin RatB of RatAB toxin-antitoxin module